MRTNQRTFPPAEIVLGSDLQPLDLVQLFGRIAPLEVDLGCGDGTFLVALAHQDPERNFLGVERLVGRVRCACRKIGEAEVQNALVGQFEILRTLSQLLPPDSVEVFHLMFPDPWPKRRHRNRRVVSVDFLQAIARALKPEGELRIATDQLDYYREMQSLLPEISTLAPSLGRNLAIPDSTFEKRFREDGAEIHRLVLRKISDVR